MSMMSPTRGRVPWRKALLALIGANVVVLAYAVRDFRQEQALHRMLRQGTPEAYAEAVEKAGPIRDRLLVNLGNLYFEKGQRRKWYAAVRAAVAYYREALRLNPHLMPAKKNYEVAWRFLDAQVAPREPREPMPPNRITAGQMPLKPHDI